MLSGPRIVVCSLIVAIPILVQSALIFPAAGASTAAEPPKTRGENLIPNGDFEAGKNTPDGWQTIDGLSSFWVEAPDPAHGKVIKLDTDVLQSQGYEWWAKIVKGADPKQAPKKQPTV